MFASLTGVGQRVRPDVSPAPEESSWLGRTERSRPLQQCCSDGCRDSRCRLGVLVVRAGGQRLVFVARPLLAVICDCGGRGHRKVTARSELMHNVCLHRSEQPRGETYSLVTAGSDLRPCGGGGRGGEGWGWVVGAGVGGGWGGETNFEFQERTTRLGIQLATLAAAHLFSVAVVSKSSEFLMTLEVLAVFLPSSSISLMSSSTWSTAT